MTEAKELLYYENYNILADFTFLDFFVNKNQIRALKLIVHLFYDSEIFLYFEIWFSTFTSDYKSYKIAEKKKHIRDLVDKCS